jgi:hypothetical protein
MSIINRFLWVFIFTIKIGYSQDPTPKMEDFGIIYQKFYGDIGSGNIESIRPLIIPVGGYQQSVFGEALLRNPAGPFGVSRITKITNPKTLNESFKRLTGSDVVLYQFLAIRYKLPPAVEKTLLSKGVLLDSKWVDLEEVFCDLWIFGSDGKWRVACDYTPGVAVDCQTLGLMFADSPEQAKDRQLEIVRSRERFLRTRSSD